MDFTREQLMSIKGGGGEGKGKGAVTVYATVIKFEWVPINTYYLGGVYMSIAVTSI